MQHNNLIYWVIGISGFGGSGYRRILASPFLLMRSQYEKLLKRRIRRLAVPTRCIN